MHGYTFDDIVSVCTVHGGKQPSDEARDVVFGYSAWPLLRVVKTSWGPEGEMGNHPSAHQPLERATSYAGNGLRLSVRFAILFYVNDNSPQMPTCDVHAPLDAISLNGAYTRCFAFALRVSPYRRSRLPFEAYHPDIEGPFGLSGTRLQTVLLHSIHWKQQFRILQYIIFVHTN